MSVNQWTSLRLYDGEEDPKSDNMPSVSNDLDQESYTPDQVKEMLEAERAAQQQQYNELKTHLDELKSSLNMTEEQKQAFEKKVRDVENRRMTTEQKYQRDLESLQERLDQTEQSLKSESEKWRNLFEEEKIRTTIFSAATSPETEAYNPEQIYDILRPKTKVADDLDDQGNATGNKKVLVTFQDRDKDGNPSEVDLTPHEALKRMNEMPEKYGNLFKQNVESGAGLTRSRGSSGKPGLVVDQGSEAYRQSREQNPELIGRK